MKCLTAAIEGLLSSPGDGWDTSIPKMIVEGPKLLVICGLKGELNPPICETNRVSTMSCSGLCNYIINRWALAQMLTSNKGLSTGSRKMTFLCLQSRRMFYLEVYLQGKVPKILIVELTRLHHALRCYPYSHLTKSFEWNCHQVAIT